MSLAAPSYLYSISALPQTWGYFERSQSSLAFCASFRCSFLSLVIISASLLLLTLIPNRLRINPALCVSAPSLCLGIRSHLLTLTYRTPCNRAPNYLSNPGKQDSSLFLYMSCIFLLCLISCFFLWWPHPPESLSQNYGPLKKSSSWIATIFSALHDHYPSNSLKHIYSHISFQVYQIIFEL